MKNGKRKSVCPSPKNLLTFLAKAWVLFYGASNVASALEFPEQGNYKQQSDFVNSLTNPCGYEVGNVVTGIADAENPFDTVSQIQATQPSRNVKVWRHEFDEENGVVFKRTVETAKESGKDRTKQSDVEEVMIGGQSEDGNMQPLTFKFQRGEDGLMKVVGKEKVKVTEFAQGVEQAGKEGLVVRADTCYTTRLRDKKTKVSI